MDYSAINYVEYRLDLPNEMYVIGGTFAAGLTEPRLARAMGNAGSTVDLYVSSSNFELLKDYVPSGPSANVTVEEDKLIIRDGTITVRFHRGIPQSWKTQSGHQVQDPLPLKRWLIANDLGSWAKILPDTPFELKLEDLTLTEEEQAFKEACASHDWFSDFSDDARVVSNGVRSYAALIKVRDALGGNAKEIFDYYSSK